MSILRRRSAPNSNNPNMVNDPLLMVGLAVLSCYIWIVIKTLDDGVDFGLLLYKDNPQNPPPNQWQQDAPTTININQTNVCIYNLGVLGLICTIKPPTARPRPLFWVVFVVA